jgi:hypothetical protein
VKDSLAPVEDHGAMLSEARQLREVVAKIASLRLDHTEYTCLKAITLFKPGKSSCFLHEKPSRKFEIEGRI